VIGLLASVGTTLFGRCGGFNGVQAELITEQYCQQRFRVTNIRRSGGCVLAFSPSVGSSPDRLGAADSHGDGGVDFD